MSKETTPITLSRALKLKNRLVSRLAQLDTLIVTYNSTPEDNQEYDVKNLYKERMALAAQLVDFKALLSEANRPIQRLIFELAECKSVIAMWNKVNTKHGPTVEGYAGVRVTYTAQFRKPDVDRQVKRIEQEIDRIQDELDQFNHKTLVTVETSLLAAGEPRTDDER
jgi:hypothetical protein